MIVSTRISTENIPTTSLQRYLYGHPYTCISTNISLSRVLLYDITYVCRNHQYDAKPRIRFPPKINITVGNIKRQAYLGRYSHYISELKQIRNARNPLNGNVLISRDDGRDKIARSCIARESVIETGAQQKPAHVI